MTAEKIVNSAGKTVSKSRHEGAMKAWATKRAKAAARAASPSPRDVDATPTESRIDSGDVVVITTERVVSKARHEGALRAWAKRRAKLNGTATAEQPAKKVTSKNRHESAMRAWETRRENAAQREAEAGRSSSSRTTSSMDKPAPVKSSKRSAAAFKAWETKRAKAAAAADARSERARKAWETRRANLSKRNSSVEAHA